LDRREAQDRVQYAQRQQDEVRKSILPLYNILIGREKKKRKREEPKKRITRHLL